MQLNLQLIIGSFIFGLFLLLIYLHENTVIHLGL